MPSLSAEARIKKRGDYLSIQAKGKKFKSKYFLLSLSKTANSARIGVTVTKKIDKRATRRNRLKRRIKEIFRLNRHKFLYSADIVIVALNGAAEIDFTQIHKDLFYLFYQASLLKPRSKVDTL